jgi:hypothetical protein
MTAIGILISYQAQNPFSQAMCGRTVILFGAYSG